MKRAVALEEERRLDREALGLDVSKSDDEKEESQEVKVKMSRKPTFSRTFSMGTSITSTGGSIERKDFQEKGGKWQD